MEVQIEIVDTHIVYNTTDNKPFKIIIIKNPYNIKNYPYSLLKDNTRFLIFMQYDDVLWTYIITPEELENIQKSNDIIFDQAYIITAYSVRMNVNIGDVRMNVNIGDFKKSLFKANNNTNDINNYMYTHLELFEIDDQQYVLK